MKTTMFTVTMKVKVNTSKGHEPSPDQVTTAAQNMIKINLETDESEHEIGLHSEIASVEIDWDTLKPEIAFG